MSYPTNDITTTYLDSANDSIGLARAELYTALTRLSELIDSRDTANGLCPLNASSQVPAVNMPTTFTSGAGFSLHWQPGNEIVALQGVLALDSYTTAELTAWNTVSAGTIAYCSDGDSGSPCLAVALGYDVAGTEQWSVISLGSQIST